MARCAYNEAPKHTSKFCEIGLVEGLAIGSMVLGGFARGQAQRRGGQQAYETAVSNANDMLALSRENAARMGQVAAINASSIRNVGNANAKFIEDTALRNGRLMMVEGRETQRRMLREGRYQVGLVRAMQAATGWSVNQGTPRIYKEDQKAEIDREREYVGMRDQLSLFTMLYNSGQQAQVTRYAAEQQAGALLATSDLERQMMLAESQVRYDAMIREGELLRDSGNRSGTLSLIGGLTDAAQIGATRGWFDNWFSPSSGMPNITGAGYTDVWGYGVG